MWASTRDVSDATIQIELSKRRESCRNMFYFFAPLSHDETKKANQKKKQN